MLNQIILMGRITAEPELKHTNSGKPVANVTLAVERDFKPQDGERETDFIDVTAWGKTAEFLCRYFKKGQLAAVKGNLETRNYEDKNGAKRKAVYVLADQFYFTGKSDDTGRAAAPVSYTPPPDVNFSEIPEDEDDDLPF